MTAAAPAPEPEPWYAPRDLTRYRVPVRVTWRGRVFRAFKAYDREARSFCWYVVTPTGEGVRLERPGTRRPEEVEAWQPLGPWPHPLPEPILAGRRLVHGARPRKSGSASAATALPEVPDLDIARYADPPDIPLTEAEVRIIRAIRTEGVRIERRPRPPASVSDWPAELLEFLRSQYEHGRVPHVAPAPRWQPTTADATDVERAMGWFAAIAPPAERRGAWVPGQLSPHQKVLVWRAARPVWSFEWIGMRTRRSAQAAGKLYRGAVERIWRVANGLGRRG